MMDPNEYTQVSEERRQGKTWQQIGKGRGLSKATIQGRHNREERRKSQETYPRRKPKTVKRSPNGQPSEDLRTLLKQALEAEIKRAREVEIIARANAAHLHNALMTLKQVV